MSRETQGVGGGVKTTRRVGHPGLMNWVKNYPFLSNPQGRRFKEVVSVRGILNDISSCGKEKGKSHGGKAKKGKHSFVKNSIFSRASSNFFERGEDWANRPWDIKRSGGQGEEEKRKKTKKEGGE